MFPGASGPFGPWAVAQPSDNRCGMDPLSLQAPNLGLVRPAIALQSDLSAVLREGRVLAGEVLQTFGGGAFLIGIGRHRVPAQGRVALEDGQRFLFVVEGEGAQLALRIVPETAHEEPQLLRALRGVLGADQPLGKLVEALLQALHAGGSEQQLGERLAALLARSGSSAERMAAALSAGGPLVFEARLALAAALSLPAAEAAALGGELERWLAAGLLTTTDGASLGAREDLVSKIRAALAELLGGSPQRAGRERAFSAWLAAAEGSSRRSAHDLASLLEVAIGRSASGADRALLLANLRALNLPQLGRGLELLLLRSLLGVGIIGQGTGAQRARRLAAGMQSELKAQLLEVAARSGPGLAREALAHTLDGLEAEQLLNVARQRAGEPLHWSLPVHEGGRWTTAHLYVQRSSRDAEGSASADPRSAWRLSLSVDLSGTGPVRADLSVCSDAVDVWLRASRQEVLEAFAAGIAELETRLASGGRRVAVHLAPALPASQLAEDSAADVRFLREHPLMDLSA